MPLTHTILTDPVKIEIAPQSKTVEVIKQAVYFVAKPDKKNLLIHILNNENIPSALVFTRTKRGADRLAHILSARNMNANTLHADRSQSQRERALRDFKNGNTRVLVATDIASRGIDVESVTHVINYDVPKAPQDYVHRVGRTGRAGKLGKAITFVTPIDELAMRDIEYLTKQKVERVVHPAFGRSPVRARA